MSAISRIENHNAAIHEESARLDHEPRLPDVKADGAGEGDQLESVPGVIGVGRLGGLVVEHFASRYPGIASRLNWHTYSLSYPDEEVIVSNPGKKCARRINKLVFVHGLGAWSGGDEAIEMIQRVLASGDVPSETFSLAIMPPWKRSSKRRRANEQDLERKGLRDLGCITVDLESRHRQFVGGFRSADWLAAALDEASQTLEVFVSDEYVTVPADGMDAALSQELKRAMDAAQDARVLLGRMQRAAAAMNDRRDLLR